MLSLAVWGSDGSEFMRRKQKSEKNMSAHANLTAGMCIQYAGLESVSSIPGYKNCPNSKQLPFFYCPSIVCVSEQTAFQRQGIQEAPKPLKQAFPLPMLNTALHSCPQKLVSTAEKKCLIERHKPSALKMGSAQSIWNWIRKKSFQKYLRETVSFSFSLFYKCQSWAFLLLLFILFACLLLITSFHHLNGCYVLCYLSTFSSFYSPNLSCFISTASLHFQMSLRFLRTAHTLKCACQPPALGEGGWISFSSPPSFPTDADSGGWILPPFLLPVIWSSLACYLQLSGKCTLALAPRVWTLLLTDGERKKAKPQRD